MYRKSRTEGYKLRSRQCTFIIVFLVAFLVMMLLAMVGAATSGTDNIILSYILAVLPYFVPMLIFAMLLAVYAIPYGNCRKRFQLDEAKLQAYLTDEATFTSLTDDGSVQASDEILFFTRTFCIVPFAQISSVKLYSALEQDIIFTLTDGKKLELVSSKKQFEAVEAAINARRQ